MPRFAMNRWWTSILTVGVLAAAWLSLSSLAIADTVRDRSYETVGLGDVGGSPPPTGVGDPDVPVATKLKMTQRGALGTGDGALAMQAVGDSRYVSARNVWMWRLSVVARSMRIYWIR